VVALQALNADLGKVILWGLLAAVPVAAVSGPIFAHWAMRRVAVEGAGAARVDPEIAARPKPSLGITVAVLTVPILLLLTQTVAELMFTDKTSLVRQVAAVIGNPTLASACPSFSRASPSASRGVRR